MMVRPILKWAGGKRWLPFYYSNLLPANFEHYIEPFLGGAAVFFSMKPRRALLTDANARLIECYEQIKLYPREFTALMRKHQREHSGEYYYFMRTKKFRSARRRAAQFLYLNRTCWNGLYRVNLLGEFNVPIGTKTSVIFDGESFYDYANLLRDAKLQACDFQVALDSAKKGDFIFVDPPYTVKHNYNGFSKYNENIFSWTDQIRLRDSLADVAKRGAKVLLCNAHHESILGLFGDLGNVHILDRTSLIASDANHRARVTEVAITVNYDAAPRGVSLATSMPLGRQLNQP